MNEFEIREKFAIITDAAAEALSLSGPPKYDETISRVVMAAGALLEQFFVDTNRIARAVEDIAAEIHLQTITTSRK